MAVQVCRARSTPAPGDCQALRVSPPGQPALPGPPTALPCRGAARTGPSPTSLLTMLVSCYRRGFRAPSCAQLLWKGRKGTKGGDARSARWARPCPGAAQPGEPRPGRAPGGPRRERARVSPTHTRERTGPSTAPPHGAAHRPLRSRAIPLSLPPHPGCSRGRACEPPLPSRGHTRLSPPGSALGSPPARQPGQSPPAAAHRGRRCLPGRDSGTRSPSAAAPRRSNQQQDGGARAGGAGAGRHSNRAVQSPPRGPARHSAPESRPTGPSGDADRSHSVSLKRGAAPPFPERGRQRTLGTRDARQSHAHSRAALPHWLPAEKEGRSANGRGPRVQGAPRAALPVRALLRPVCTSCSPTQTHTRLSRRPTHTQSSPPRAPGAAPHPPPAAARSGVSPMGHAHAPLRYHKGLNSRTVTVPVGSGQKGPSGKVTQVTPSHVKFHGWPLFPFPPFSHLLPKLVSSLLSRQRFISPGAAREASRGALL